MVSPRSWVDGWTTYVDHWLVVTGRSYHAIDQILSSVLRLGTGIGGLDGGCPSMPIGVCPMRRFRSESLTDFWLVMVLSSVYLFFSFWRLSQSEGKLSWFSWEWSTRFTANQCRQSFLAGSRKQAV